MDDVKYTEYGITIPISALNEIGIKDPVNDKPQVIFSADGTRIIITKHHDETLMDQFAFLLDEPNYGELDWGPDVGNEWNV